VAQFEKNHATAQACLMADTAAKTNTPFENVAWRRCGKLKLMHPNLKNMT